MRSVLRILRHTLLLAAIALLAAAAPAAAQSETVEYYGTDAVGSVRIVFNASGTMLGRQDYDPFGREILSAWGLPPERFGGQTVDREVQQADFHARQFQSRTGRFLLSDPVFGGAYIPEQWNRYAYGKNNPLRFTDYGGLWVDGFGCSHTGITKSHIDEVTCPPTGGGSGGSFMAAPIVVDAGWAGEPGPLLGGGARRGNRAPGSTGFEPDVTNNGPNVIFVKQESDAKRDQIIQVSPNTTWKGDQDGIADPCGHPGQVFKSVDGQDITFTNGDASTSASPSLTFVARVKSRAGQLVLGGWQGDGFLQDHGDWKSLFDAAKQTPPGGCK
jgi:RHS repeat-associated protein